jgi:peptide/nickel transport system permease protein
VRLLLTRFIRLVAVALLVSFFSYLLLELVPGDPTTAVVGITATDEAREEARAELGLDKPLLQRYGIWLGNAATGDLGESTVNRTETTTLIRSALPKTLELAVLAQLIALGLAIPAAVYSARRPGKLLDRMTSAVSFGTLALPSFVLGVYLIALFAVQLDWLPALAKDIPGFDQDPLENLRQMILPAFTLALGLVASYLVLLRSDMVATLQEDYVMLARARGLSERRILWRHAFRPSSLNLLTTIGLSAGALIGGALVIEVLFAVPGIGRLMINSVFLEDYSVVQALVLVFTISYVLINFGVDLLYAIIDPRIRRKSA